MAPRTAKTKKVTDTNLAETIVPKKGRGKAKNVEETEPDMPEKVEEKAEVAEKAKSTAKGRGRKAQPKAEETEENAEQVEDVEIKPKAAPKGKKKGSKAVDKPIEENNTESQDLKVEEPEKKTKKGKKVEKKTDENEENGTEVEPVSKKKKPTKKQEKGQGDAKEENGEDVSEPKSNAKTKRGKKVDNTDDDEEAQEEEPTTKRRRKVNDEKATNGDSKKKAPLKNKASSDYDAIDFSNSSKNSQGKAWNFKLSSWNVDGIRAWLSKGGLDYIKYEKPDILCLQEVKCSKDKLPEEVVNLPGYHAYWLCSEKDGYAGVGIYTTKLAMNVQYGLRNKELDSEGRIITAEYEEFYLICTYVPNAGRKLVTLPKRLEWNEEFHKYVKELDKKKPVIICGDMNVAHNEIDLKNPKTNKKNAGFTDEERAGMTKLLGDGFVDTFRHMNPDKADAYTFWSYMMNSRSKNVGWRLDYFIVSERLMPFICDNVIRSEVYGSDHCPLSLFLHLTSAEKPKE